MAEATREFAFLEAAGNRFAVWDELRLGALADPAGRAVALTHELGLDGLLVLAPATGEADGRMLVFNRDGSRAEACGNGLRCVARLFVENGHAAGPELLLETDAGTRRATVSRCEEQVAAVRTSLGTPRILELDLALALGERVLHVDTVDMGNPHCVLHVAQLVDADVRELGPLVEHHTHFPARTNVAFVAPHEAGLAARFWERGVGETASCGSGSGAVAAVAIARGGMRSPVAVQTRGGRLVAEWKGAGELFLEGPVSALAVETHALHRR